MKGLKLFTLLLLFALPDASADFSDVPTYPPPEDLTSERSTCAAAWNDLVSTLEAHLQPNTTTQVKANLENLQNVTFSLSLFSLHDTETTELQYHYTSSQIAGAEYGTNTVDADSIYRIASVSKLLTVFTGMLTLSDTDWNRPLTEYFPGLRDLAPADHLQDPPRWEQITPRALASHMGGIGASGIIADLALTFTGEIVAQNPDISIPELVVAIDAKANGQGLPPLPLALLSDCQIIYCNSTAGFIDSIKAPPPVFELWTTPAYSNLGMFILGQVLLNVTGKSFGDYDSLYGDEIFSPLNMSSTLINAPMASDADFTRSVIAGPLLKNWAFPADSPTIPSGGLLSTLNDLNKLGVAILNHTLLSPVATRQWMKPVSHTASLSYSVGAPWEIVRYVSPSSGKLIDIYTKLGDSGAYSAMLAMIPEFDAGFSFLSAYDESAAEAGLRSGVALGVINELVEAILPALEAQAAREAEQNYVGTFTAESDLNYTLVIAQRAESNATIGQGGGLFIERWISNGTNALSAFSGMVPRLLPVMWGENASPRKITFQVTTLPQWPSYTAAGLGPFTGFYDSNLDWFAFDGSAYGGRYAGRGLGTFVFELDERGYAVAVSNAAAPASMKRLE